MTPEQAIDVAEHLHEIVENIIDVLKLAKDEKKQHTVGFLQYVEQTYNKIGEDQYAFRIEGLKHVVRDLNEVYENYLSHIERAKFNKEY